VEQFKDKVVELNENPNFVNTISKERERVLMHNTAMELKYESGVADGLSQGEQQAKLEIAKKMIAMGLTEKQIINATELSEEEVQKLRKETEN